MTCVIAFLGPMHICSQDHSTIDCHNLQSHAFVITTLMFLNASQFCSFKCCTIIALVFFQKEMPYISSFSLNINYKKTNYTTLMWPQILAPNKTYIYHHLSTYVTNFPYV